jgi:riboflavin biosynthesis pyrimidine reductase
MPAHLLHLLGRHSNPRCDALENVRDAVLMTRRVVLADRPRFETRLAEGLSGLPQERLALVHYEALVRDPLNVIGLLYEQLRLDNFSDVERGIKAQITSAGLYTASNTSPPDYWKDQIQDKWRSIFEQYNYRLPHSS